MSIEVHLRIRPGVPHTSWVAADTVLFNTTQPSARYVFNRVHAPASSNQSVYASLEPLISTALHTSKSLTVMAYGQTGSGKTHTMLGDGADPGFVPRAVYTVLHWLHSASAATSTLKVSFIEIYNEVLHDLLDVSSGELRIWDGPDGTVSCNSKRCVVDRIEQFEHLLREAESNRKTTATQLNADSSRSHMIITLEVETTGEGQRSTTSSIHLVDLAGSENAARAQTEGQALREGGFINRSLLALGNVVDAMVDRRSHIPYRDAKLTRVLRCCFGPQGLTALLCCIHPGDENVETTMTTLRFTQRAMKLKRDPIVVLPLPPLFTHQYAKAVAQATVVGEQDLAVEYERGIHDGFQYSYATVCDIAATVENQLSDTFHSLAGLQRLLVAHDQAVMAQKLSSAEQVYAAASTEHEQRVVTNGPAGEADRLEQMQEAVAAQQAQLAEWKRTCEEKTQQLEAEQAAWEHQWEEVRQREAQYQPEVLLQQEEQSDRQRIMYEWLVCVERLASQYVQPIITYMERDDAQGSSAATPTSPSTISVEEQIRIEREALQNLKEARAVTVSLPADGGVPHLLGLQRRLEALEREERVLQRQLRFTPYSEKIRQLRRSRSSSVITPPRNGTASQHTDAEADPDASRPQSLRRLASPLHRVTLPISASASPHRQHAVRSRVSPTATSVTLLRSSSSQRQQQEGSTGATAAVDASRYLSVPYPRTKRQQEKSSSASSHRSSPIPKRISSPSPLPLSMRERSSSLHSGSRQGPSAYTGEVQQALNVLDQLKVFLQQPRESRQKRPAQDGSASSITPVRVSPTSYSERKGGGGEEDGLTLYELYRAQWKASQQSATSPPLSSVRAGRSKENVTPLQQHPAQGSSSYWRKRVSPATTATGTELGENEEAGEGPLRTPPPVARALWTRRPNTEHHSQDR